jgi:hypothetical protein
MAFAILVWHCRPRRCSGGDFPIPAMSRSPGPSFLISVIRAISGKVLLFRSTDHARSSDYPIFLAPPPICSLLLQTKALTQFHPRMALAWRLGGPCVALGWPLGGPRVTQSQSQSAEGRKNQPTPLLPSDSIRNPPPSARLFCGWVEGIPDSRETEC